jgi:hypothetical protein
MHSIVQQGSLYQNWKSYNARGIGSVPRKWLNFVYSVQVQNIWNIFFNAKCTKLKLNACSGWGGRFTKIVYFVISFVEVLPPGQRQNWCFVVFICAFIILRWMWKSCGPLETLPLPVKDILHNSMGARVFEQGEVFIIPQLYYDSKLQLFSFSRYAQYANKSTLNCISF